MLKKCNNCCKIKHISEFYKRSDAKDGHRGECKFCTKEKSLLNHKNNLSRNKDRMKRSYYDDIENRKQLSKNNYYDNKEKKLEEFKKYRHKNRDKLNFHKREYLKKRRKNDFSYLTKERLKRRIKEFLRHKGIRKSEISEYYLGCTYSKIMDRLLSQGYKDNMHIDHIVPLAVFDGENDSHKLIMFNYLNLQPLPVLENIKKGKNLQHGWESKIKEICIHIGQNAQPVIDYIKKGEFNG